MKNTLLILFLTVAFAFSSYADTKVLSVATNGTEVITITETTNSGGYVIAGIRYPDTVTTNVSVSTLPQPLTEKEIELQKEVEEYRKEQQLLWKAQLKAEKERKEQKKKKAEAYRNAYEFLSKPISKKEEK